MVYSDDTDVAVFATTVEGAAEVGESITTNASYTVDVVSAASVDVVTSASPAGFEEVRHQARGSVGYEFGEGTKAVIDYGASVEPDFVGHGLSGSYAFDLLERNVTLSLGYALRYSVLGVSRARTLEHERTEHEASALWSEVLGRRTVLDVGATGGVSSGYLSNPYRLVRLYEPGAAVPSTAVPEALPELRSHATLSVRLRQRFADVWHGLFEYRLYGDGWGVWAHTASTRQTLSVFDETVLLSAELRGYLQSGAELHRARYETFPAVPNYRSADKELGGMRSVLGGIDAEWSLPLDGVEALRIGLGFDTLALSYSGFLPLASRLAFIGSLDATLEL
ncbi:MAG: DUF3570 domain-containing protein [Deltaproteobacteria bacterium]|nr:DUF3570 domain-containing protein [Deltaproteobacteria bacterium]